MSLRGSTDLSPLSPLCYSQVRLLGAGLSPWPWGNAPGAVWIEKAAFPSALKHFSSLPTQVSAPVAAAVLSGGSWKAMVTKSANWGKRLCQTHRQRKRMQGEI